jgi:LysR family transcriptional regulator AphB
VIEKLYHLLMNGLIDAALSDLALLVRVADSKGFTAAARLTRMPQTTVSRRIAALEARFGVRLFDRTTRKVALTPAGLKVYDHAKLMLTQGEAAAAALTALKTKPAGTLRVTSTVILGQALLDEIAASFMAANPDVRVRLNLTGRRVDLVEEGFDIAIRVGALPDSSLAVTRLAIARNGLFASPAYLRDRAMIHLASDLEHHPLLAFGQSLQPKDIVLNKDGRSIRTRMDVRMACDDPCPLLTAASSALGVAEVPRFVAREDVRRGRLIEVLPDHRMNDVEINAVTPSYRGTLPSVREFIGFARSRMVDLERTL